MISTGSARMSLQQYPAQARAVWELHDRDIAAGDWQKVIDRQRDGLAGGVQRIHGGKPAPRPAAGTAHRPFRPGGCRLRGSLRASRWPTSQGPPRAWRRSAGLETYMHRLRIDPVAHQHPLGLLLPLQGRRCWNRPELSGGAGSAFESRSGRGPTSARSRVRAHRAPKPHARFVNTACTSSSSSSLSTMFSTSTICSSVSSIGWLGRRCRLDLVAVMPSASTAWQSWAKAV